MQQIKVIPRNTHALELLSKYSSDDDKTIYKNNVTKTLFFAVFEKEFSDGCYILRLKQQWPQDKINALKKRVSSELIKDGLNDEEFYIEVS